MSVCAQSGCINKPTGPTVVSMSVGEAYSVTVNPLWDLLQDWIDSQPIPPTPAKVAETLGISQSSFDTWKKPRELLTRRMLWKIHSLTKIPFKTIVDAAIESVDLYNPARAEKSAQVYEARKTAKRQEPARSSEAGVVPPARGS